MDLRPGGGAPRGLTPGELALVAAELADDLSGSAVLDTARVAGRDDLLLFLGSAQGRRVLHIAPGGARARVCTTRRRFTKQQLLAGPTLSDARIAGFEPVQGERRIAIRFRADAPELADLRLEVELFGGRAPNTAFPVHA